MNTRKMIAAALRARASYAGQASDALSKAVEPATLEEGVLKIALVQGDSKSFLLDLADYFDGAAVLGTVIDPPVPEVAALVADTGANTLAMDIAQDAVAGMAVNQASESTIRILDEDEIIEVGDEWRLKDGLHHRGGHPSEWRVAGGSVGQPVGNFPDSIFRRH